MVSGFPPCKSGNVSCPQFSPLSLNPGQRQALFDALGGKKNGK
jgi:hypothetical protein